MFMGMSILGHAQESLNMRPSWRTHLTLSPSVDVVSTHGQFYAHGSLEYYFEEGYSISGEFLSSLLDVTAISNKQVSAGATKHWVQKQNDWFIGFQPGVFVIDSEESVEGVTVFKGTQLPRDKEQGSSRGSLRHHGMPLPEEVEVAAMPKAGGGSKLLSWPTSCDCVC